ncbi:hypothetical protein A3H65_00765 [Candidatus Giovannonibacteria bacterium RIFCSPLOWO2_02_FULL_45_14]|nr:MAG: hypothetical protein A3H65_00765 [Candidatus Giovannonibacteria bacterium RIFCSPLOWO2_02_FULL_45_14]
MDFDLAVLSLSFVYFLLWFVSDFRIRRTDWNLGVWIVTHPGVWPGDYERGRELVQHCLRAYMAGCFFPSPVNPEEKLRELRALLRPKEKAPYGFVFQIKIR